MARTKPTQPTENVLVVEGINDRHVFWSIFQKNGIPDVFTVEVGGPDSSSDEGGYEALRQNVEQRIKNGDHKRIGIVVDADTDLIARWNSLRSLLIRYGYSSVPAVPAPEGTVVLPEDPEDLDATEPPYKSHIGVWIMPDNTLPGALEEWVRRLVPDTQAELWAHAETSVATLPMKPDPLTENWLAKARLHSYLAWQKEPGKPMGQAITAQYLSGDAEAVQPFLDWVKRLYKIA